MSFVVFPQTDKLTSIHPAYHTKTFTLTCLPIALVGGFFEFVAKLSWQTVVVLHGSVTARSAILKLASKLIAILKVNHSKTTKIDQTIETY